MLSGGGGNPLFSFWGGEPTTLEATLENLEIPSFSKFPTHKPPTCKSDVRDPSIQAMKPPISSLIKSLAMEMQLPLDQLDPLPGAEDGISFPEACVAHRKVDA